MIKVLPKGSKVLLAFGGNSLGIFTGVSVIETKTERDVFIESFQSGIYWGSDGSKKKYTHAYRINELKLSIYFMGKNLK